MESFKINKIENIENEIKRLFQIENLIMGELTFGGVIPIIFVRFASIDELTKNWKEFNSYVAAEYMTMIKDDYSKWNFYIFYFSCDTVDKQLKYEIENNKFSSRKIIIESCESITETEIENVISEHITNDNIKINVESKQISAFQKNSSLSTIIDKLSLIKKNDEDLQNVLNQIENIYKNEIQES